MKIEKISYKGHTIETYQDNDYFENPNECDNTVILVNYHRDLGQTSDAISKEEVISYYNNEKIEQSKDYWIYPVSMFSHSGVVLSLEKSFGCDCGGWDTSHVGLIMVKKKPYYKTNKSAYKRAKSTIEEWNHLLAGEVYGYITESGGCGGYIGDYDNMIQDAKKRLTILWSKSESNTITRQKRLRNKVGILYRA